MVAGRAVNDNEGDSLFNVSDDGLVVVSAITVRGNLVSSLAALELALPFRATATLVIANVDSELTKGGPVIPPDTELDLESGADPAGSGAVFFWVLAIIFPATVIPGSLTTPGVREVIGVGGFDSLDDPCCEGVFITKLSLPVA